MPNATFIHVRVGVAGLGGLLLQIARLFQDADLSVTVEATRSTVATFAGSCEVTVAASSARSIASASIMLSTAARSVNTYSHVLPSLQIAAAAKMDAVLGHD